MGFPSPAQDYVERSLSLDELCIHRPAATYFMRAANNYVRAGIQKGAVLVVDASAKPCDGSVVIVAHGGEFVVKRLQLHPKPVLVGLDYLGEHIAINLDDMDETPLRAFWRYDVLCKRHANSRVRRYTIWNC